MKLESSVLLYQRPKQLSNWAKRNFSERNFLSS